jgi:hypothetical protein
MFFTSALHGREWLVSRAGRFVLWDRSSPAYWVGSRVGLDAVDKRKITFNAPAWNRTPGHPDQSLANLVTLMSTNIYFNSETLRHPHSIDDLTLKFSGSKCC